MSAATVRTKGGGEVGESGEARVTDGVGGGGRRVADGGFGGVDEISGRDWTRCEYGATHCVCEGDLDGRGLLG